MDRLPRPTTAFRFRPTLSPLDDRITPTLNFDPQLALPAGTSPFSGAVGDFDGDGRADLAVANNGSGTVSVLRNTTAAGATTPTFAAKVDFATGTSPFSVAVGDFDGDGRADLAVANNGSATVSVLRNTTAVGTTTLTFAAKVDLTVAQAFGLGVADLDGDGRADLIAPSYFGAGAIASVFQNTTAAGATTLSFAAGQQFTVDNGPRAVAVADFDGDGRPDFATANETSSTVSVFRNTSTDVAVTGPSLIGQFGTTGVWRYHRTNNTWVRIDPRNAFVLATAANGNAVASFTGVAGVWYYRASTNVWSQINGQQAFAVAMDPLGNAIINFGPAFGTYRFSLGTATNGGFTLLAGTSAGADKLAVSANGDVIANFNGFGVWRFRSTTGWVQLNGHNATSLAVDGQGFVTASFAGFGVGRYIPFANGWQLLTPAGATAVAVDGTGNVHAAFAGYGIGRWSAATGAWTNVGPGAAATSLAADWFGNVTAAVPGFGVSEFRPFAGWFHRRNVDANILRMG